MNISFDISFIVGTMALFIFIYRFFFLLIPMFSKGIKEKNNKLVFDSLTLCWFNILQISLLLYSLIFTLKFCKYLTTIF